MAMFQEGVQSVICLLFFHFCKTFATHIAHINTVLRSAEQVVGRWVGCELTCEVSGFSGRVHRDEELHHWSSSLNGRSVRG